MAGPTASGKSALALDFAKNDNGVIINADSMQIYREIPIITAQPGLAMLQQIPHFLYGTIAVTEPFSVAKWLELVQKEINNAHAIGKTPILVGGTGMYIKALTDGIAQIPEISTTIRQQVRQMCEVENAAAIHKILCAADPQMAAKLNPADTQRLIRAYEVLLQTGKSLLYWQQQKSPALFPPEIFSSFILLPQRDKIYRQCEQRLVQMVEDGALDEIKALADMQLPPNLPAMRALGVPEFLAHVKGELTLAKAIELAQQHTRNYVKRQFTWFRHQMPGATVLTQHPKCN